MDIDIGKTSARGGNSTVQTINFVSSMKTTPHVILQSWCSGTQGDFANGQELLSVNTTAFTFKCNKSESCSFEYIAISMW